MRRMWELFAAICLVAISSYGVAQAKRTEKPFETVQKALATTNTKNVVSPIKNPFGQGEATRLAMATLIIGHCNDHYGQMMEYVRMNGIVPPASQHKAKLVIQHLRSRCGFQS